MEIIVQVSAIGKTTYGRLCSPGRKSSRQNCQRNCFFLFCHAGFTQIMSYASCYGINQHMCQKKSFLPIVRRHSPLWDIRKSSHRYAINNKSDYTNGKNTYFIFWVIFLSSFLSKSTISCSFPAQCFHFSTIEKKKYPLPFECIWFHTILIWLPLFAVIIRRVHKSVEIASAHRLLCRVNIDIDTMKKCRKFDFFFSLCVGFFFVPHSGSFLHIFFCPHPCHSVSMTPSHLRQFMVYMWT